MARYKHSFTFTNDIDEVFAYISNPVNNPVWDTSILNTPVAPEDGIRSGTRGSSVSTFLGNTYDTIFTYDDFRPPMKVAHRTRARTVEVALSSGLRPVQRGTRVTLDIKVSLKGIRKLLGPILSRKIRERINANLEALQIYMRFKSLKRD